MLELPLKFLSFDTGLNLGEILREKEPLLAFFRRGGRLALGLIPTQIPDNWQPERVCEDIIKSLFEAFGPKMGNKILTQSLLSPACGLGLRSIEESRQVFQELKKVQELLQERLKW